MDDAFRQYLAERGAKPLALAEVTTLVTGAAGLRLAGDAVLDLWSRAEEATDGNRSEARDELLLRTGAVVGWYEHLGQALVANRPLPAPLEGEPDADSRLLTVIHRDLDADDGRPTPTAVRIVWTGDHIDAARRLQVLLVAAGAEVQRPG